MKYFFLVLLFLSNNIFSDYSKHPDAKEVIATLVRDHGFEKSYVVKVLESAKKQEKILKSMSSPAEFTWTWDRYKKLFLEDKRITNGRKFIKENASLFDQVENEFGVPREIITSILETLLPKYHRIIYYLRNYDDWNCCSRCRHATGTRSYYSLPNLVCYTRK